ncbi:MAG: ATP-dependent Clp protease adapter ClpS [Candidatus Obscuribacterales bacterium]|nr:ATP-dependent Clp protease adapter ClpS [Candidatus Obscuribacterales bacterium]
MADWDKDQDQEHDDGVQVETKKKLKKPPMYKVLLHNDDYTTMDFVIRILTTVFHKQAEDAVRIMYAVHLAGIGVAGVYTYEVAEAKVDKVIDQARAEGFPLLCTMEED